MTGVVNTAVSANGLLGQREGRPPARRARQAFWRTLALVRPHRRNMIVGMVLGLGVALTYAASLGGMLPVLKVITSDRSLHETLLIAAGKQPAPDGSTAAEVSRKWYAPLIGLAAPLFPAGNAPGDRMVTLLILLGGLVAVNLIGNVLRCLSQYLVLNASHRMMMDLRRKMYRKACAYP